MKLFSTGRKIISNIQQGASTITSISFTVPTGCIAEVTMSIRGICDTNTFASYKLTDGTREMICSVKGVTSSGTMGVGNERFILPAGNWTGAAQSNSFTGSTFFTVTGYIERID